MIALGVTGTDTGVGKTMVAAAICACLHARGLRVAPMKPLETGVGPEDAGDAGLLLEASGSSLALEEVSPFRLREPLAPLVAAERAGVPVDLEALDAAYHRLRAAHDAVVVEGAGGLLVPLTPTERYDTLFARWGLDVVLVAANRLGAINHTLLTVEAAARRSPVRAVVLNAIPGGATGVAEETNAEVIRRLVAPVPVLTFPLLSGPVSGATLARHAEARGFGLFCTP